MMWKRQISSHDLLISTVWPCSDYHLFKPEHSYSYLDFCTPHHWAARVNICTFSSNRFQQGHTVQTKTRKKNMIFGIYMRCVACDEFSSNEWRLGSLGLSSINTSCALLHIKPCLCNREPQCLDRLFSHDIGVRRQSSPHFSVFFSILLFCWSAVMFRNSLHGTATSNSSSGEQRLGTLFTGKGSDARLLKWGNRKPTHTAALSIKMQNCGTGSRFILPPCLNFGQGSANKVKRMSSRF